MLTLLGRCGVCFISELWLDDVFVRSAKVQNFSPDLFIFLQGVIRILFEVTHPQSAAGNIFVNHLHAQKHIRCVKAFGTAEHGHGFAVLN